MNNKINTVLLILLIILNIFLIYQNSINQEDLNHDGKVNSADLLYLRRYLIIEMEEK